MTSKNSLQKKVELRRAVTSSAFTLIALITAIGLFSLYSIWSINRAWLTGATETAELQQISRASLDAQVAFKVQVQEWKNMLLRGRDKQLLDKYHADFRQSSTETAAHLERVAAQARLLGLEQEADAALALREAHRAISARYDETLKSAMKEEDTLLPDTAHEIDLALRGVDRKLETDIGLLATEIARRSEQRLSGISIRMEERYRTLRGFIIGVILLSLLITGYAVWGALRATRT